MDRELRVQSRARPPVWPCAASPTIEAIATDVKTPAGRSAFPPAGVFQGYVPSSELLNVSAGFRVNNNLRIHGIATNLLDQQRFQLYGGSVIGRRVLGGITANF
jgi:hypothetical protein